MKMAIEEALIVVSEAPVGTFMIYSTGPVWRKIDHNQWLPHESLPWGVQISFHVIGDRSIARTMTEKYEREIGERFHGWMS